MNNEIKVAVVGAGAIGGITAAFLSQEYNVQIVCKYEDKAKMVRDTGLHIIGVRGEHHIKMDCSR